MYKDNDLVVLLKIVKMTLEQLTYLPIGFWFYKWYKL